MQIHYSVRLSVGSIPSSLDVRWIRNTTFENIDIETPIKTIYVQTNPGKEGTGPISQIVYRNITGKVSVWYPI